MSGSFTVYANPEYDNFIYSIVSRGSSALNPESIRKNYELTSEARTIQLSQYYKTLILSQLDGSVQEATDAKFDQKKVSFKFNDPTTKKVVSISYDHIVKMTQCNGSDKEGYIPFNSDLKMLKMALKEEGEESFLTFLARRIVAEKIVAMNSMIALSIR